MTNNIQGLDCWMDNVPDLYKLRIDELILPGTHDSGADKKASTLNFPQEITQDVPASEQIKAGFRVLDLRVRFLPGKAANDPKRFQLYHWHDLNRFVSTDILDILNNFYDGSSSRAKELIILNFHQFDNFTEAAHDELRLLINEKIGKRLIPSSFRYSTIDDIWKTIPGRTVVISYNKYTNNSDYWDGVQQQWSGENYISTDKLKKFMDEVSLEPKRAYSLRSIQCAKYTGIFVPDDFSDKIDKWFHSEDGNSYIQRFHIINTDWSTRSRIVQNCLHANQFRAAAKH
ncbi:hypothetical protein HKK52_29860 [Pseudomonas sp. ADAK2]|uniref:hypothetical protein n=1 Tax=unclassified Pseudomonas TaxID=196821 RepID=UPI001463029A|nr:MULTISPECIES: hypothetical protein [unclassified Pseudomonas]QJI44992.1 hypothetical protein HKK53_29860 [Pseudomonas sp. ADAK7]QJI51293.1 hypothetical protein HKK52_29860 [Pseudomonas sp. ADAK2]